ncbi:DUF5719 family protein [Bifidobacterium eulemuris]|uniref:Organic solvents resistance ABC transporter permease n=1 Tax=Bifidobacterium eulemuris TaxID=1765219 RepID=A0A261GC17_9BIFI|nr:DUF5719 family protein [Bifidobacterium eulemuris]OZG68979.1 hypothetical protein BEUL_0385 [Bifidobacterium eulemuris]QOL31487.1 hypothetical protein BE0216_02705 [Bifidobacterium eulemuris]
MRKAARIGFGLLTMLVILAISAVLVFLPGPSSWVDDTSSESGTAVSHTVSPTQLSTYCPSPMGLSDTETYGDSAYQASVGNQSSTARYAAFGSVYRSTISAFGADDGEEDSLSLESTGLNDADAVLVDGEELAQNSASRLMDTRLLSSGQGVGVAGAVASQATDGDLKGVSAASCIATDLTHSFLLAGTETGTTQQLIVANPSSKATTVDIQAWGSDASGALTLATSSTLAVPAYGESTMDIAAAASGQDGLYMTVSSAQTPVAAVVRTVSMDGLDSKGSDFAMPLGEASTASVVPSIAQGDETTAYLFSTEDTDAVLSWVGEDGLDQAEEVTLEARRVTVIDLGQAPQGALALAVDAETEVNLAVATARSGADNQADFALTNAAHPVESSAVVIPDGMSARVTLANASDAAHTVTLHVYDTSGSHLGDHDIEVGANAAVSLTGDDLSGDDGTAAVLVLDDESHEIGWGVLLTNSAVDEADMAGLATLEATSLMPQHTQVWARSQNGIVH